ncbi:alanyl-tRNA editing protein [Blautia producta]|uniref:alanyl-tRNA editing protein n=1 Tax=Blautia producta TaxID=33035 RepID=UPI0031B5F12A
MTEKLFYRDSMIKKFQAEVLSCSPLSEENDINTGINYEVVLDRTAFFPEGGGQYADTGVLRLPDTEIRVLDVRERQGVVFHCTDRPAQPKTAVTGVLDFEERFSKMQQHTGEHIVSGIVNRHFGYRNVGFHLGNEAVTMDYDGPLTKEQLRMIEQEANQAVAEDIPIEVLYPAQTELDTITYRSKIEIEGQVRIVRIPGYDTCACCAPHVRTTGAIGIIKLTGAIHYKGGMRVNMLCGFRALKDYNRKEESVAAISGRLSAKQEDVVQAVCRLETEIAEQKEKIKRLQEQYLKLRLCEVTPDTPAVLLFEEELDPAAMRRFVNDAMEITEGVCGVFVGSDKAGYRYVLGSTGRNITALAKEMNQVCSGKGGGKPPMVQGSLTGKRKQIEKVFLGWMQ